MRPGVTAVGGARVIPSRWRLPTLAFREFDESSAESDPVELPALQIWRDSNDGILASCHSAAGVHRVDLPEIASYQFDDGGGIVRATARPRVPAARVREAYERVALPLVLQALETEVLHASAVLIPSGVLAFCGVSGAGKSTLAYSLHRRGYPVRGDDAVAVDLSGVTPWTVPLPFRVRLRSESASFLGLGAGGAVLDADGAEPAPLVGICVLKRAPGGAAVTVEALRPAAAFAELLAHAYCFSLRPAERKRRFLDRYLEVASRVPVFEIAFESCLESLPHLNERIEQLAAVLSEQRG